MAKETDNQMEGQSAYESMLARFKEIARVEDDGPVPLSREEEEQVIDQMVDEFYKAGLTTSAGPDAELTDEGVQFMVDTIMSLYDGVEEESAFEPGCAAYVIRLTFLFEEFDVWRDIKVPLDITVQDLHCMIQAAFGWHNLFDYHFVHVTKDDKFHYIALPTDSDDQFMFRGGSYVEGMIDFSEDWRDARDVCLFTLVPTMDRLMYVYDYLDLWKVDVAFLGKDKLEDGRVVCIDGYGEVPTEGMGGEEAYNDLINVLCDPDDPDYDLAIDWALERGLEPYDEEAINARLAAWRAITVGMREPSEQDVLFTQNAKYLGVFVKTMMDQGLSNKTVDSQSEAIDYYLNDYLCWRKEMSMEEGMAEAAEYLGTYLLADNYKLPSLTAFRNKITSIKKFYKIMCDNGFADKTAYQDMLKVIKEKQAGWLDHIKNYRWY